MDRYSIFAVCTITQNFHPQEDCASNTDPNAVTAEYSARDVAQPADRAWHPFSKIDFKGLKKGGHTLFMATYFLSVTKSSTKFRDMTCSRPLERSVCPVSSNFLFIGTFSS